MSKELKTIKVAAAAIIKDGKFLAACRPEGKKLAGFWELPGGKLEPHESYAEACVREIKEELDCDIKVDGTITVCEYDYPEFHLIMEVLKCSLLPNSYPRMIEPQGLIWVDENNAKTLQWAPADSEHVQEILDAIK